VDAPRRHAVAHRVELRRSAPACTLATITVEPSMARSSVYRVRTAPLREEARVKGGNGGDAHVLTDIELRRDDLDPLVLIQEMLGGRERLLRMDVVHDDDLRADFYAVRQARRDPSRRVCDIPNLNLKLVVHHGHFARQKVGGRARVAGPDVILIHRLLKNPVGGSAYLLLTASALERVGMDPVASGMRQHSVSYPHLGEVPCFVADLEPLARPDLAAAPVLAA
jgi:hypothetical protein